MLGLVAATALLLLPGAALPPLRCRTAPAAMPCRTVPAAMRTRASAEELTEQLVDFLESSREGLLGSDAGVQGGSPLAAAVVPLRVLTGLLMMHHGSEGGLGPANFGTPQFDGFVDFIMKPYFGFLPGPVFWAAVHDYVEFFGGGLLALGLLTRPASAALLTTMLGAVYFHLASTGLQGAPFGHVENYSYNFEEPTLYACIFFFFMRAGSGPLALDPLLEKAIDVDDEYEFPEI